MFRTTGLLAVVASVSSGLLADTAQAAAGDTGLVSVTANGRQAAGYSNLRHGGGAVSADGHYVVFYSFRANLARGDRNTLPDVFLRDRERQTTLLVSGSIFGGSGNDWSGLPAISDDGRLVCFTSAASNLVAADHNDTADIFVWNRETGRTELASVATGGVPADDASLEPSISADGRYVAFTSFASNLAPPDPDRYTHIYLRDRQAGTTQRMTVGMSGGPANGYSWQPSVSADGRYVAFYSNATDLVADDRGGWSDVFVRDRLNGVTRRVSVDAAGVAGTDHSVQPVISANGRYVTFISLADDLVPGDTNARIDVFVHDLEQRTTERVSLASDGRQANDTSYEPSISADGGSVTFESHATNLVAGDTNGRVDVFVHDRTTHRTRRVSVRSDGAQANGDSFTPSLSADGRFVAFRSDAANLASNDLNALSDIYLHELAAAPGTSEAAFTLKPAARDFGSLLVGSSLTRSFWLLNKGTTALAIRRVELRGADSKSFGLEHGCPPNLAAGQGCGIRVTFRPLASGAQNAALKVTIGDGVVRTRELLGIATP